MPSKTKFQKLFANPVFFEGIVVISREYSKEEALIRMASVLEYDVPEKKVYADKIRYQFLPQDMFDDRAGWLLGAEGRGAKGVWVYERG